MSENIKNLSKNILKFSIIFKFCWNNFDMEHIYDIVMGLHGRRAMSSAHKVNYNTNYNMIE